VHDQRPARGRRSCRTQLAPGCGGGVWLKLHRCARLSSSTATEPSLKKSATWIISAVSGCFRLSRRQSGGSMERI
jgi:hypothetical protein